MGTFGCTPGSPGSLDTNNNPDNCSVCKYTLSEDGLVVALTVYGKLTSGTGNMIGVIYADSGGAPGALVATTQATPLNTTTQWWTLPFAAPVNLAAGTYWLGWLSDSTFNYHYDNGSTDQRYSVSDTYSDGPEDPYDTGSASTADRAKSIFATYAMPSFLTGYNRRKALTFDAVPHVGASTDVVVAVHVPAGDDFWSNEDGDGTYVRFTGDDGTTTLPFEVESYDATGDDAWWHVRVTLDPDVPTTIFLYYAADSPSDGENTAGTWDANFIAVYHLNEDLPGGDETTPSKGGPTLTSPGSYANVAAQVDKGVEFDGAANSQFEMADPWYLGTNVTIEVSFNLTAVGANQGLVTKYQTSSSFEWMLWVTSAGALTWWVRDGSTNRTITGSTLGADADHHAVGRVVSGGNASLWRDGAADGTPVGMTGSIPDTDRNFRISGYSNSGEASAIIDEVTISNVARSDDWIAARNQSRLGTWLTVGTAEAAAAGPTPYDTQIGGEYRVLSAGEELTLPAAYRVVQVGDPQLPSAYAVRAAHDIALPAAYTVEGQANEVTLPAAYRVITTKDLNLPAAYRVLRAVGDIQLTGTYRVRATKEVTLSAAYEVTGGSGTISLTEPTERSIVQRQGGVGSLDLAGTYTGSPTGVEARIVLHGTSTEVVPWTVVDAAPSGGSWSGTLADIPQGGWYNVQVRFSNQTGTTDDGTNRVGVGILIGCIGQSNIARWFGQGTGSPDDLLSLHNVESAGWIKHPTTGVGGIAFGGRIIAETGLPVGLVDYGVSGAALIQGARVSAGESWWTDPDPAGYYHTFLDAVTAVGGDLEGVIWVQGEREARSNWIADTAKEAAYLAALQDFFTNYLRTDIRADLPIGISLQGRDSGAQSDPVSAQGVRNAQVEMARIDPLAFVSCTAAALEITEEVHHPESDIIIHGDQCALTFCQLAGEYGHHRGPQPIGYVEGGNQFDVYLRHRGTVDITPTPGVDYSGWEVLDNGTPMTITSVTRFAPNRIRIITSGAPAGTSSVRHLYGDQPAVTNPARASDPMGLPVEGSANIPPYRSLTLTLVDRDGTARASLTGLRWALFDLSLPDAFAAPVLQGSGETTSAGGVFSVVIGEVDVPVGGNAWLIISDSDGTAGQNPTSIAFSAPVAV